MKSLLTLVLIGASSLLIAQDKIEKRQGDMMNVKVIEVNDEFVSYRLPNEPNGVVYKIRKESVSKITYENGTVETFANAGFTPMVVNTDDQAPIYASSNFGKNIVNFDFLSILYNEIGMSYERVSDNGFVGFKIPFILGMGTNAKTQIRTDVGHRFQIGLDVNLYPTGQGSTKYFIGPSIRIGESYDYTEARTVYNSNSPYGSYEPASVVNYNVLAFQVNNGIVFQPTYHFNVSLILGIGLRRLTDQSGVLETVAKNYGTFNANVAYRF